MEVYPGNVFGNPACDKVLLGRDKHQLKSLFYSITGWDNQENVNWSDPLLPLVEEICKIPAPKHLCIVLIAQTMQRVFLQCQ